MNAPDRNILKNVGGPASLLLVSPLPDNLTREFRFACLVESANSGRRT